MYSAQIIWVLTLALTLAAALLDWRSRRIRRFVGFALVLNFLELFMCAPGKHRKLAILLSQQESFAIRAQPDEAIARLAFDGAAELMQAWITETALGDIRADAGGVGDRFWRAFDHALRGGITARQE